MRLAWAILGSAVMLAGCGGGPADMTDPNPQAGATAAAGPASPATCGADAYQGLVGKAEAMVQVTDLPSPALIYQVGAPIPQDFNPRRLKVEFSKTRVITRVFCG